MVVWHIKYYLDIVPSGGYLFVLGGMRMVSFGERASHWLGVLIKAFLAFLLIFFVIRNISMYGLAVRGDAGSGWLFPLIGVYAALIAGTAAVFFGAVKIKREWLCLLVVFAFALALRLTIFIIFKQKPINDFLNYYTFGLNIKNGDLHTTAMMIGDYQMPKMGGLALFNTALCFIFGDTSRGQQLAHVVISALICPAICYSFRRLDKRIALLAALLYAIYPSSLISAQFSTNHHGAALFFIIAVGFFIEALSENGLKRKLLFAVVSAAFLVVSDFIHSSSIIIIIAMAVVMLFSVLRNKKLRLKNLCAAALLIAMFFSLGALGTQILYRAHVIYDTRSITPLFKVLMGFNEYYRGAYSDDYNYVKGIPFDDQNSVCLHMLKDRLNKLSPTGILGLFAEKTDVAWFGNDLYFYFFIEDELDIFATERQTRLEAEELTFMARRIEFTDGMQAVDNLFLLAVYLLSAAGMIIRIKRKENEAFILSALVPLGWMLFIMISEVQSRYRFPAIPFYMVLAATGVFELGGLIARRKHQDIETA